MSIPPSPPVRRGLGITARTALLVAAGMLVPMAILVWVSWAHLEGLNRRTLRDRGELALLLADHVENALRRDIEPLFGISGIPGASVGDPDREAIVTALHRAYIRSQLLAGVFLLDAGGVPLWEEPSGARGAARMLQGLAEVGDALRSGRPGVTGLVTASDGTRRIFVLVPLQDWEGRTAALAGASMDPTGRRFQSLVQVHRIGESGSACILDGRGITIACTDPSDLLRECDQGVYLQGLIARRELAVETCHGCHGGDGKPAHVREAMAVAPIPLVGWGVVVRQGESEAGSPVVSFLLRMLWLVPLLFGLVLLLAWGAARGVTRPLAVLTDSAERIASGDLDRPIPPLGRDETGRLGRSLETMRAALSASLEEVTHSRDELEKRVAERTRDLQDAYRRLREREESRGQLLRKVISAQEDERKRIARELHDETCQDVTAIVMGLDSAIASPSSETASRIGQAKALAVSTLDDLHRIIYALRPSVLDDLGLLSAIRWYAARQIEPLGIAVRCEVEGTERRLPLEVETAVFRVVQEALTNIVRHAEADSVLIQIALLPERLTIEIEDDGKGFDPSTVAEPSSTGRGLGLLGIRERVELLGGTVQIDSSPGRGTRLALGIPLQGRESHA